MDHCPGKKNSSHDSPKKGNFPDCPDDQETDYRSDHRSSQNVKRIVDTDIYPGNSDRQGKRIRPGACFRVDQGDDGGFGKDIDGVGGRKGPGIGAGVQKMGGMDQMARALPLEQGFQNPARKRIRDSHADGGTQKEKAPFQSEPGHQKSGRNTDRQKEVPGIGDIKHGFVEPSRMGGKKNVAIKAEIESFEKIVQGPGVS